MHTQDGAEGEMKILCFCNVEAEIDEGFGARTVPQTKMEIEDFAQYLTKTLKSCQGWFG